MDTDNTSVLFCKMLLYTTHKEHVNIKTNILVGFKLIDILDNFTFY